MAPKPAKAAKTPEARAREAEMIREQLDHLGFPDESLADVRRALDEFAGEGWGLTKTYRMPDLGVAVSLLLSTQPRVISYARVGKL